ncbi:glycosyltransferase family 4 protein [Polynucleobacter paneuropaeus]|jgi:glycosyltransferase involved in cell wall biosynthesis|nr:glycosyltransferase family 4 protein [Polynucleobacter paneuropaeus]
MSKKLLIEGWRGINHSYAMVNQYQMLALAKLGIDFCHHDLPFFNPNWNQDQNFCGFDEAAISRLNEIKTYTDQDQIDATYRISFPYRLYPSKSDHLFVFGTSEYQSVTDDMIFDDGLKIKNADRPLTIITPSNWSKVGFLKAGFRDEQVKVIPHGVDQSIFKPLENDVRDQYRNALGSNKDTFVILSVGAMTANKGIDLLLGAYLQLKPKYPQIKLVLKDQSNLYGISANDVINQYCTSNGINLSSNEMRDAVQGFFVISQNLNLNQLNGLYNAADCYVSPYRAEGFNLTPLEAAAAGTPIIVTKGGSTDDYVDESFATQIASKMRLENGMSFLEPSLESLVEKIANQINRKSIDINIKARQTFINQTFTWESIAKKFILEFSI